MNEEDYWLLEVARDIIRKRHKEPWHKIGAALRTKNGKTFAAVHIDAGVGRIAVCAEAIAIGMAASAGDTDIDLIVAVNSQGDVVSPCGMCRELISDYAPHARVLVPSAEGPVVMLVGDLLPNKYR